MVLRKHEQDTPIARRIAAAQLRGDWATARDLLNLLYGRPAATPPDSTTSSVTTAAQEPVTV